MITIKFKKLERSELAREAVLETFQSLIQVMPELESCKIQVTLWGESGSSRAGPDRFKVETRLEAKRYGRLKVDQSATSLYTALSKTVDFILKQLNPPKKARQMRSKAQDS